MELLPLSFYQDPRWDSEQPSSNHFPRLLVLNTQYIKKWIPHSDRKKMEQLIRLELSQFMAKLKRVPTMDKSSSGRKSMASRTGVPARFSRSPRRGESAKGVLLIYTWLFLSFRHSCSAIFVKQRTLSEMEGQCHSVRYYPSLFAPMSQSAVLSILMNCLINCTRWHREHFFYSFHSTHLPIYTQLWINKWYSYKIYPFGLF